MSAGAWVTIGGWAAGLICAVVGTVRALRAAARLKKHAKASVPQALIAKAIAAQEAAERVADTLPLIESLVQQMTAALDRSALALRELRGAFSLRR